MNVRRAKVSDNTQGQCLKTAFFFFSAFTHTHVGVVVVVFFFFFFFLICLLVCFYCSVVIEYQTLLVTSTIWCHGVGISVDNIQ